MSFDDLAHKQRKAAQRRRRSRSNTHGTADRPRLSVHVSNKHISAQVIDDITGKTLVYSTSVGSQDSGSLSQKAAAIGSDIAVKAAKIKIKKVTYDRGARKYHGRVKNLADAARGGGLEL